MAEPSTAGMAPILRDMLAARRTAARDNWLQRARWRFSPEGWMAVRAASGAGSWVLSAPDPATGQPRDILGLPWSIDHQLAEPFALDGADGPR